MADLVDSQLLKEQLDRMLGQYDAKAKTFQNTFITLLVSAAAFFFLIFTPYLSLFSEGRKQAALADSLQAKTAVADSLDGIISRVTASTDSLKESINNGTLELQSYIRFITRPPAPANAGAQIQQSVQTQTTPDGVAGFDPCGPQGNDRQRWNCLVGLKVNQQFDRYRRMLDVSIIKPCDSLRRYPEYKTMVNSLDHGFGELPARFKDRFAKWPDFWLTMDQKVRFSDSLQQDVNWYFSTYVNPLKKVLSMRRDSLLRGRETLQQRSAELKQTRSDLEERLKKSETPLSVVPLDLDESIALFPFAVATGFTVCIILLVELLHLRREILRIYRSRHVAEDLYTVDLLHICVPIWMDPLLSWRRQLYRVAAICVLPALFISALVVMLLHQFSDQNAHVIGHLPGWLYPILYVLGAILTLLAITKLKNEFRLHVFPETEHPAAIVEGKSPSGDVRPRG